MDTKLQDIVQRLNRRLNEARKFQNTLASRIKKIDEDCEVEAQQPERKKKP